MSKSPGRFVVGMEPTGYHLLGRLARRAVDVGGFWSIQAKSKSEAVEWATQAPLLDGDMIEIRQVQELSDFPEDVQQAAGGK